MTTSRCFAEVPVTARVRGQQSHGSPHTSLPPWPPDSLGLVATPLPVGSRERCPAALWESVGRVEGMKCTPRRRRLSPGLLPASRGGPWHGASPKCCYSDAALAGAPRSPLAAARALTGHPSGGRQVRPSRLSSWPCLESFISPSAGTRTTRGKHHDQ